MNRIFVEGFWTSLLGLIVLSFCALMLWEGKSTPADMSGWFLFGTTLLRAKDSLIGIKPKKT